MGNQLAGIAPSQIFPVEHYLTDLSDLTFDVSLGSTRFMKVARARSEAGHVVVKVFTVQDQGINLRGHRQRLLDVRRLLEGCLNCLPFQRVYLTDRAGFMVRQYVRHSLYDRMSTRPFLTPVEKRWVAFQLLLALQQAHKHGVCHGDVKSENVVVTSWNWVFLTDFASFKPVFLPEDNPADFSYFFDTSRRRTCYVAPERFRTRASGKMGAAATSSASSSSSNLLMQTIGSSGDLRQSGIMDKSSSSSSQQFLPDASASEDLAELSSPARSGELSPAMDIFSAGCVLIELFTDSPPFTLSGLLAYRAGDHSVADKVLSKVEDDEVREMLSHMIQLDPSLRHTANEYLAGQKGRAFPGYFYTFLQSYMQIFSTDPGMMPDQKVVRIRENLDGLMEMCSAGEDAGGSSPTAAALGEKFDAGGLGLVVTLVTANIRSLQFCASKIAALETLARMAEVVSNETILDRILPYVMVMLSDAFPAVRICAIRSLTTCLSCVRAVPASDANVFPEYVLPALNPLCSDKNQQVRAVLAGSIAALAKQSVRFLDLAFRNASASSSEDQQQHPEDEDEASAADGAPAYEMELAALHDSVGQMVSVLMADSANAVKQSMLEGGDGNDGEEEGNLSSSNVRSLAEFFGRSRANDVILSHMITFLNDKDDPRLRDSFYRNIVSVVAFIGWPSTQIIVPLLQQGLSDPEEAVVTSCLHAMSALVRPGLMSKPTLYQLLPDAAPYLLHPNLWIRQATAGLVTASAEYLHCADVAVRLKPLLRPYTKHEMSQVKSFSVLMSSLESPVPRGVIDNVLHGSVDTADFFAVLEDRQRKRNAIVSGDSGNPPPSSSSSSSADMDHAMRQLFRRLMSDGMTSGVEDKLILMRDNLVKQANNSAAAAATVGKTKRTGTEEEPEDHGVIELGSLGRRGVVQVEVLTSPSRRSPRPPPPSGPIIEHHPSSSTIAGSQTNEEWHHMFGDDAPSPASTDATSNAADPAVSPSPASAAKTTATAASTPKFVLGADSPLSARRRVSPARFPADTELGTEARASPGKKSSKEGSPLGGRLEDVNSPNYAKCKITLDALLRKKRVEHALRLRKQERLGGAGGGGPGSKTSASGASVSGVPPPGWRPKGQLRAHLHEHDGAVVKLAYLQDKAMFASASKDGCVRLWDCLRSDNAHLVNRAHKIYNSHSGSALTGLSVCSNDGAAALMATSADDGTVHVTR